MRALPRFTNLLVESIGGCRCGTVIVDSCSSDGTNTRRLLAGAGLLDQLLHDTSLVAETSLEVSTLLVAAFGDYLDFAFVPSPKPFVFYADNDEYITFFANNRSNLNAVTRPLAAAGFETVEYYLSF